MDERRFDGFVRLLGGRRSRRAVMGAWVAGALAGAPTAGGGVTEAPTALAQDEVTAAGARCRKLRRPCNHDSQCCTLKCGRERCRR